VCVCVSVVHSMFGHLIDVMLLRRLGCEVHLKIKAVLYIIYILSA